MADAAPWEAAKAPDVDPAVAGETAPNVETTVETEPLAIDPNVDTATSETANAPEAAVEGEVLDLVIVTVPKAYKLCLDGFHMREFKAGIQQMERSHAEHWYSVANGVAIYTPAQSVV